MTPSTTACTALVVTISTQTDNRSRSNTKLFPFFHTDTPLVGAHRHIVNTIVGETADLHCDFNSTDESKAVWLHGDRQLHDGDKYKLRKERRHSDGHHRSSLQVHNVQSADLGVYRCVVRNSIGEGQSSVRLVLQPEPPRFESVDVKNVGHVVITHWSIRSHQALSEVALSYMKNGSTVWMSEQAVHYQKNKEHSGMWK